MIQFRKPPHTTQKPGKIINLKGNAKLAREILSKKEEGITNREKTFYPTKLNTTNQKIVAFTQEERERLIEEAGSFDNFEQAIYKKQIEYLQKAGISNTDNLRPGNMIWHGT